MQVKIPLQLQPSAASFSTEAGLAHWSVSAAATDSWSWGKTPGLLAIC